MKFIQISIALPGMEKPLVLGTEFKRSAWSDSFTDAEIVKSDIVETLKFNNGGLMLDCSDGVLRLIGAALMAQSIVEISVVEITSTGAGTEVPNAA